MQVFQTLPSWLADLSDFRYGSNGAIELRDRRGGTCSDS